jgi:hypothetical protein
MGGPRLDRHRRRETSAERFGQVVPPSMFERDDGSSRRSTMFPPDHRCQLWRPGSKARYARLRTFVDRQPATRTVVPGLGHHQRPACAAQTTIQAAEWLIAVWTHAGKQGFDHRRQHAPRSHAEYRSRQAREQEPGEPACLTSGLPRPSMHATGDAVPPLGARRTGKQKPNPTGRISRRIRPLAGVATKPGEIPGLTSNRGPRQCPNIAV